MLRWFKRRREEGSTAECEHAMDPVGDVFDEHECRRCEICGRWLEFVKVYKCKKCGKEDRRKVPVPDVQAVTIELGYSPFTYVRITLCEECYNEYKKLMEEIKAYIDERAISIQLLYIDPASRIALRIDDDWKKGIGDLIKYFRFISKARISEEDGVWFYAFPGSPFARPCKIIIKREQLFEYLRAKKRGGE